VLRFSTSPSVRLTGDVDLASVLRDLTSDYTLKGMFFARYVGDTWATLSKELREPPPSGKYHAFESYPMSDYLRLFDHYARARFPGSTREAYRLVARGEVEVFAASTLGKVAFAMLRDPGPALLRFPELFGAVSKGAAIGAERLGPRSVAVTYRDFAGAPELTVGVLEGLVMAFDEEASVDAELDPGRRALFTVRW